MLRPLQYQHMTLAVRACKQRTLFPPPKLGELKDKNPPLQAATQPLNLNARIRAGILQPNVPPTQTTPTTYYIAHGCWSSQRL